MRSVSACCFPAGFRQRLNKQWIGNLRASCVASGIGETQPSAGAEIVAGLPYNLAIFGTGARHSGIDLGVRNLRVGTDLYDLGAGVEWNIPNRTRVVPYLRGGVGVVHVSARATFGSHGFWVSGNKFAGIVGGGLRIHLKENYGLLFDLSAFDGPDLAGMGRFSVGFFYRFR